MAALLRPFALSLLALTLLSACAKPTADPAPVEPPPAAAPVTPPPPAAPLPNPPSAQPQPSAPQPAKPEPKRASGIHITLMQSDADDAGSWSLGQTVLTGEQATVPAEKFVMTVAVPKQPAGWIELPETWVKQVKVTGATPRVHPGAENLTLSFDRGEPGSLVTLRLPAIAGQPEATYQLTRAPLPRVAVEVNSGAGWSPVEPGRVYPPQTGAVRLRFTRAMDRESVVSRIQKPEPGYREFERAPKPLEGARLEWLDDQTLLVHLTKAPPVAAFYLTGARSADGLFLTGSVPVLRFGEAPFLNRLDPGSGGEWRVTTLPADVSNVRMNRGGGTLLVHATLWQTGRPSRFALWQLDTASGARKAIPFDWQQFRWLSPDGEVRSLLRHGTGYHDHTLSPDGTRIAAVRSEQFSRGSSPDFRYTFDLVILSPEGQVLQTVPDFALRSMPPRDGDEFHFTLAWSPDGKRVAAQSDDREGAAIVVADLGTGQVRRIRDLPREITTPTRYRFAYSGELFLLGGHLLDQNGKPLRRLPQGAFSPDGRWLLFSESKSDYHNPAWGLVGIAEVATGQTRMFGEGLPAGWTPAGEVLIIRWADWEHRFIATPAL